MEQMVTSADGPVSDGQGVAALAEAMWRAVLDRDAGWDGRFVFSVESTGIYCRPSCGARRPRRANVRFHDDAAAAERAGYRACLRCRPAGPPPSRLRTEAVAAACRLIETAEVMPDLGDLAAAAGFSRFHFHRLFKAETGLTPRAYAAAHRARRLRDGLGTEASVTAAIYGAGFNAAGRFYAAADDILGMAPRRYRAGGAGEEIRHAAAPCSLGHLLVGASARGICAILLGDGAAALEAELAQRFPRARLVPGDAGFAASVAAVVAFVDAPRLGLDLPLDIRGTAFQERVWQALRAIPPGTTTTYTEIAARIGAPRAVRAVGAACAANPLAVAVPCHRVVGADGDLAGYRWGVDRKRALLARERGG